jgi:hypothetical protein
VAPEYCVVSTVWRIAMPIVIVTDMDADAAVKAGEKQFGGGG